MSAGTVVGTQPWLPWPLSRSRWWTVPVPAERLAALRIGLGLVMLFDLWLTYPGQGFFAVPGLTRPGEVDAWYGPNRLFPDHDRWPATNTAGGLLVLLGFLSPVGLVLGLFSRLSACAAWLISVRLHNYAWSIHNGGDMVRIIALFYLMLSPCGAVWSVDAHRRRRRRPSAGPVLVPVWPVRLLLVQLALIYFCNGVMKLLGSDWRDGLALHWVMGDLVLVRWSPDQLWLPDWLLKLVTWLTMFWEILFPLLVARPPFREVALGLGVAFHLSNLVLIEVGLFPVYMLCLYLPLLPWERLGKPRAAGG